jgi:UDP-N-acetylglucosamine--N-acetylmuramyl-(pentapeptide) pyrophosphoryl-undecaprenol N-acetylglucosamine transferase
MNSLCEIAALSKPSIVIPLPSSTNDHQLKNAQYLLKHGAIRMLSQDEAQGKGLINEISKLVSDKEAMQYLSESIHKIFRPHASTDLAKIIISLANKRAGEK